MIRKWIIACCLAVGLFLPAVSSAEELVRVVKEESTGEATLYVLNDGLVDVTVSFKLKLENAESEIPLGLFFVQLGLNVLWPWMFFGLRQPGLAFLEIALLWGAVLFTLASFWLENKPAGLLLVPYLAWVSFAAILNFSLWRLN